MQPLLETVRMASVHISVNKFPPCRRLPDCREQKVGVHPWCTIQPTSMVHHTTNIHGAPHNHHPWCTTQQHIRHHTTHSHYTMMDNMLHTSTLYCTTCHTTPLALDTLPPVHTYIDGAHIKTTQPHFYRATYNLAMIVHRRLPQVTTKPRSPLH